MATILIVDDAAFMRVSIRTMLAPTGHQVVGEAENGYSAIQKYHDLSPDLVTMDITMPEMDGVMATKEIMKLNPQARILMISAMGQEFMVREAVLAGAKGFIVKPFKADVLIESIDRILK